MIKVQTLLLGKDEDDIELKFQQTLVRVIGRMKMHSRTVRGYKTEAAMLAGLLAAASGMC